MKAITVEPLKPGSARLEEVPEPDEREGSILVEAIAVGVCGTDAEIVEGKYGWAPPGKTRLVLGHESLGRVMDPGPSGSFQKGDLLAGIVRRPDAVPCPSCAVGEWDMCRNGQYTEHGIKQIDGFMSERWRIEPQYTVKIERSLGLMGVLLEPTTVVAKAWEQVGAVGYRAFWEPKTALVTGAGPIGLLAALIGRQRGFEVHVLDRFDRVPSRTSYVPWARPTTRAPSRGSVLNPTSSSSARAWGSSSPTRSGPSRQAGSCASRAWGPGGAPSGCRPPTSGPPSCFATTSSSGA